jgi:hypothetical protein
MSFDSIGIPSLAVNGFLWHTMKQISPSIASQYEEIIPFYPIGDSAAGDEPWDNNPYFIYDRVFRFNSSPFYENKRESTLYYLKAREVDSLEWSAAIQMILDREDDSAKDINEWIRNEWRISIFETAESEGVDKGGLSLKEKTQVMRDYRDGTDVYGFNPNRVVVESPYPFYFHNLRVYQSRASSPSSDGKIREFSTVQPYHITEFMIDTHFHFTQQLLKIPKLDSEGFPILNEFNEREYEYKYDRVKK